MDTHDDDQQQLPDAAPVELADQPANPRDYLDDIDADLGISETPAPGLSSETRDATAGLENRELADGAKVSDNTSGCWAVYDNHELRFVPGGRIHDTREGAQRELDELRPTTGHDLVAVEV